VKDKEEVIREIDKLDKLSEKEVKDNLKKLGVERVLDIFKKPESYFKKYRAYSDVQELKNFCKLFGVKFNFVPSLARGLSYYDRTIFEIKGEMKETIGAGGSYEVNGVSATGISFGLDRLELLAKIKEENKRVLVISLNQDKKAIEICDKIRSLGIACSIYYGKPTKALDYANSYNIPYVIFIGKEEVKKKKLKLKQMTTGKEKMLSEKELKKLILL